MRSMINMRNVTAAFVTVLSFTAFGCASTQSTGEEIDDAAITTAVNAQFALDPQVEASEIDVDTTNGAVRLSGYVDSAAVRAEAEKLALRTKGVRSVRNDLKVGDKTAGDVIDDATVGVRVKARLVDDSVVKARDIDVDVQKGVVTLSGIVRTADERNTAERLARGAEGVREVRNLLRVDPSAS